MSDVYALPCLTCGHLIDDHESGECWNYEAHGEQCHCPWMRIPDTCAACGKPAEGFAMINDQRYCHPDDGPSCYMGQTTTNATTTGDPMWAHDQDHTDRLRGHRIRILLRGIPDTLHDLEPAPRHGIGQRPTERQLPISERVLEAKQHLRATLASWALLVAEERHTPAPRRDDTATIATWLTQHAEWLARHPAGQDAEDEIQAATQQLEHLTDTGGPTIFAGNCPTCDTPTYAPEGRQETRCKNTTSPGETCDTPINVTEGRARLLTQATTMTASAADIARILPVKAATVRQWGRRGKLGGYCDTTTRETRWHIGTVIDQINRTPDRIAA